MTLDTILASLFGVGAGGYAVWRKLKSDKNSDAISENAIDLSQTIDNKTQKLVENLERQLEYKTAENKHLTEAIERVASERNEAVQEVGGLRATVNALGDRVTEMKAELTQFEEENKKLAKQVDEMTKALREFGEKVIQLATRNQELMTKLQKHTLEKEDTDESDFKKDEE